MRRAFIAAILAIAAAHVVAAQNAGCAPSGGLTFICGVANPEDLVLVPNTRWMLASGMAPGSGLHLVDTRAKTVKSLYAAGTASARPDKTKYAACPGPLDPKQAVLHGLSLRAAPAGRYTVYATNHGGRESVEVFELDASEAALGAGASADAAPTATWIGCVLAPGKMSFNSVAAFSDGTLVATVLITPDRTFEDAFAQRITGVVLTWTPGGRTWGTIPNTELSANNGIETSPDDREFYVVSTTTKRVVAYDRRYPGKAVRVAQLKDFAPDNVRWTSDNRLITAGMIDDEPACGGAPKTEAGIRCPRGYIVATIDPKTMRVTEIARGPATPAFTGTAIAMVTGGELWLGSFNADRLAYRTLKP
jgi:SMP-30/gluconolaconase/LRE-like protein